MTPHEDNREEDTIETQEESGDDNKEEVGTEENGNDGEVVEDSAEEITGEGSEELGNSGADNDGADDDKNFEFESKDVDAKADDVATPEGEGPTDSDLQEVENEGVDEFDEDISDDEAMVLDENEKKAQLKDSGLETAKYIITGLVDYTDEQGNIVGQLQIGSVQEFPVELGDKYVADGRAEKVQ